jgi:DNA-binding response OmpR family regulator
MSEKILVVEDVDRPDLVVLDLAMKGMYGMDVLGKLREIDGLARVIVASADVQLSSHEMAAQAGAAGFVTKPIDPDQLLTLVRSTLRSEK